MQFGLWRAAAFVSSPMHLYRYKQVPKVLGVYQDFSARWHTGGAGPGIGFTPDFCISVGYMKTLSTDFDKILCVEDYWKTHAWICIKCCVSTDVGTWTNWLTFEPDPDYSPDSGTGLLSPISFQRCYFTLRKSDVYVGLLAAAARSAFNMVLFTEAVSRRNTFVGGKCAPSSALLVIDIFPKFKMAAAAILDFQVMNLAISACWQCGTWALYKICFKYLLESLRSTHLCFSRSFDDVTRINSRFRLLVTWSSPHGRDASSHKIWCRYLYPIRSYWHFPENKDGCRRHLGFVGGTMEPYPLRLIRGA